MYRASTQYAYIESKVFAYYVNFVCDNSSHSIKEPNIILFFLNENLDVSRRKRVHGEGDYFEKLETKKVPQKSERERGVNADLPHLPLEFMGVT